MISRVSYLLESAMPRWPMNGSTHVITGSGDHTTQKGKRSALGLIAAKREPFEILDILVLDKRKYLRYIEKNKQMRMLPSDPRTDNTICLLD